MSDLSLPCNRCGAVREFEIIERLETVTIKGREVSFTAHFSRCKTCGCEIEALGQLDENLAAARGQYGAMA